MKHTKEVEIRCPHCGNAETVKNGRDHLGDQRYKCLSGYCGKSFKEHYKKKGWQVEIKRKVIDMGHNGSGVRDTGRVLGVDKNTVISILSNMKSK